MASRSSWMAGASAMVIFLMIALFASGAEAAEQSVPLAAGVIFKDVRLVWEGPRLIFYATFRRDGNEMPLYLEWSRDAAAGGPIDIDVIEQYGHEMPVAITLMTMDKGFLYMGRPAPNTPRVEGGGALNARLVMTDNTGQTDEYKFSLARADAGAAPAISALK